MASQWLQILRDLLFVLRGLWLLLGFNILALIAFLLIPQGTDMLLSMLEAKSIQATTIPIIVLLFALFFWSVSSEFCTRFLIYMTDNSGHTLSPDRVALRKYIQKKLAHFFLYYPCLLVAIACIKAFTQNLADIKQSWWLLLLVLILICLLIVLLNYLYKPGRKKLGSSFFRWMHLSEDEKYWTSKLYGIFNDYRVDLYGAQQTDSQLDLPRKTILPNGNYIPAAFQLKEKPRPLTANKNIQVWIYRIPLSYYKNLITQLLVLASVALSTIVIFALAGNEFYQTIGAVALISFAFGCWQIMYTVLHFLDKAQPIPKMNLLFRLSFLIWICFCSYINNDHPARTLELETKTNAKPVSEHFKYWLANLEQSENNQAEDTIPIFFLASEGGALRTGAFTAMLLAKLQDSFPNFKNHIYCYSGVSGGSLGMQFFYSLPSASSEIPKNKFNNTKSTAAFFERDFLSPVTGKLVFGELLNYFIPKHISAFDRAIALERAWESGWAIATNNAKPNVFASSFNQQIGDEKPALFINTVEAETGMPAVWSNTLLDSSFALASLRDLHNKFKVSIPYSTAINLGTRFPLISPAALLTKGSLRLHYLDGGYFENKGQQTILEILQSIQLEHYPKVKPYILQFNFSQDDSSSNQSIHFANEMMEIINGIENTRYARVNLTTESVKNFMRNSFDTQQIINLNLEISVKKLPMNWLLSKTAMNRIDAYTDSLMQLQKEPFQMQKIFNAINNRKKQQNEKNNFIFND